MPQEIGFGKLCCTVPVETNRINICVHILGQREHPFRANVIRATKPHKQRNINDYEGDPISEQAVIECIKQAEQLYKVVSAWLATNRPDLA